MSLRVDLDARVLTRDGEDAGSIDRAVMDPASNQITDFVVNTGGWLGRQVLVPVAEIEAARRDGDVLRLRLSKQDLEQLPTFVPEQYAVPPAGWVPPEAYALPYSGFLWPASYAAPVPYVPPVTAPPVSQDTSLSDVSDPEEVSIPKGAVVLDRAGEDVGVVEDVRLDAASGQLAGFVLRVGGTLRTLFGGGDCTEVTRSQVDHVSSGVVHLRLSKDEIERLAREQSR